MFSPPPLSQPSSQPARQTVEDVRGVDDGHPAGFRLVPQEGHQIHARDNVLFFWRVCECVSVSSGWMDEALLDLCENHTHNLLLQLKLKCRFVYFKLYTEASKIDFETQMNNCTLAFFSSNNNRIFFLISVYNFA